MSDLANTNEASDVTVRIQELEKREQTFCKLLESENIIPPSKVKECTDLARKHRKEGIARLAEDIMIEKGVITDKLVSKIYAGQGRIRCPECGTLFGKFPSGIPKKASCANCQCKFMVPEELRRILQHSIVQYVESAATPPAKPTFSSSFEEVVGASAEDCTEIAPAQPITTEGLCGQTLDKYKIEKLLGEGGMGAVYCAYDLRLERMVALKVLAGHMATNPRYVERFLREARVAAKISHSNLVQIYDVGTCNGLYYIVMEFVDGQSLADKAKQAPLSPDQALHVLEATLKGLSKLHNSGIVHRDIKPDNILLTKEGLAKLSDFGLAKKNSEEQQLTQTGAIIGTPHFMSPEQCAGTDVDARADIYSLGLTLYFMLTGRVPYLTDNILATLHKHINEPPPELESSYNISPQLDALYHKMVAKDRNQRYSTVDELLQVVLGLRQKQKLQTRSFKPKRRVTTQIKQVPATKTRVGKNVLRKSAICLGVLVLLIFGVNLGKSLRARREQANFYNFQQPKRVSSEVIQHIQQYKEEAWRRFENNLPIKPAFAVAKHEVTPELQEEIEQTAQRLKEFYLLLEKLKHALENGNIEQAKKLHRVLGKAVQNPRKRRWLHREADWLTRVQIYFPEKKAHLQRLKAAAKIHIDIARSKAQQYLDSNPDIIDKAFDIYISDDRELEQILQQQFAILKAIYDPLAHFKKATEREDWKKAKAIGEKVAARLQKFLPNEFLNLQRETRLLRQLQNQLSETVNAQKIRNRDLLALHVKRARDRAGNYLRTRSHEIDKAFVVPADFQNEAVRQELQKVFDKLRPIYSGLAQLSRAIDKQQFAKANAIQHQVERALEEPSGNWVAFVMERKAFAILQRRYRDQIQQRRKNSQQRQNKGDGSDKQQDRQKTRKNIQKLWHEMRRDIVSKMEEHQYSESKKLVEEFLAHHREQIRECEIDNVGFQVHKAIETSDLLLSLQKKIRSLRGRHIHGDLHTGEIVRGKIKVVDNSSMWVYKRRRGEDKVLLKDLSMATLQDLHILEPQNAESVLSWGLYLLFSRDPRGVKMLKNAVQLNPEYRVYGKWLWETIGKNTHTFANKKKPRRLDKLQKLFKGQVQRRGPEIQLLYNERNLANSDFLDVTDYIDLKQQKQTLKRVARSRGRRRQEFEMRFYIHKATFHGKATLELTMDDFAYLFIGHNTWKRGFYGLKVNNLQSPTLFHHNFFSQKRQSLDRYIGKTLDRVKTVRIHFRPRGGTISVEVGDDQRIGRFRSRIPKNFRIALGMVVPKDSSPFHIKIQGKLSQKWESPPDKEKIAEALKDSDAIDKVREAISNNPKFQKRRNQ